MKTKNILIAGGAGYLGGLLKDYFGKQGCQIKVLTRNPKNEDEIFWDGKSKGEWMSALNWADVLINLAGKSVDCRYNDRNKQEILNSRINSTKILTQAILEAENAPSVWLNASSATIYTHADSLKMTEDEGVIGDDFSMNICKSWEAAFYEVDMQKTKRVALRTSIVFGNGHGAFPKLKALTKLFMGGQQGNGQQYVSWVHEVDFCRAVDFIIEKPQLVGAVNIVAPKTVTNGQLMVKMRTYLKRPFGLSQPKWLLEFGAMLIGTETELLLKSRNVYPERLLDAGFEFKFNTMDEALRDLC
ncbi:TIGR01777 family oxidoreductase [Crocinitomix catalasitica]|uniref:TIGR01777 family oxidoreductase n=1 Tax=Crocinitomix catalasitica TaxID=184607 RepID=UPI00047F08BC|nr:TIGR01777 family oxidoreductase [Crocinitomix catalasitica]